MTVYVASPEPSSIAALALRREGIPFNEYICEGDYGYGALWTSCWNTALPFVVVEWDVVPWPGAIEGLLACAESPWCAYRYPVGGNITTSLGIGRYNPRGDAPAVWAITRWDRLDGEVVPILRERLCPKPHIHEPPCAHASAAPGAVAPYWKP